jgi:hypothetical protein
MSEESKNASEETKSTGEVSKSTNLNEELSKEELDKVGAVCLASGQLGYRALRRRRN